MTMNSVMVEPESTVSPDNVYVINPDDSVHDALRTLLGASGYRVTCFPTAEAFIDANVLTKANSGFLLVEADLSGIGSITLVRLARRLGPNFPTVMLISTAERDIAKQAIREGAIAVLEKPLLRGPLLRQPHQLPEDFGRTRKIPPPRTTCGFVRVRKRAYPHQGEVK